MKRALKIILPLLLLAALVGGTVWYFLSYNPLFLHELLLDQAQIFTNQGNYTAAAWCYEQAARLSSDMESAELAMKLTDRYLEDGNYTKAEYTLTMAIQQQPTVDLYLRLSQVYVAQDKLLDAAQLLEQLPEGQIKDQLEAMRPPVPTANPKPGSYDTYISVSVAGTGGTLYATNDGTYPSTWQEPYDGTAFELPGGETTLLAMTVGENGLVSPLATLSYTVVGVIEPITLSDAAVEAAVREMLSIPEDEQLYTNDLWEITSFEVPEEAGSVEDLAGMIYLETLAVRNMDISGTAAVGELTKLSNVTLSGCNLDSALLEQLASLPELRELALDNCSLSNISPLQTAKGLTRLNLSRNAIRDIDALSVLSNLEYLDLGHNALTSLAGVAGLEHLAYLDVSYNAITSMAPLATCPAMTYLDVSENQIAALAAVDQMPQLGSFLASHNRMENVDLLAGCTELVNVDVSYNALTNITALSTLVKMTTFNFSHNQVTELPALPKDCALVTINGEYNLLETLDPLADFMWLDYIYMDYNEDIETIDALENCPNLVQVNVYGTAVSDVSALTDHSIIVNYDPT